MVPDRGFVKQLKTLCPTFEVVWDCVSCKWEIWDFPEHIDPYCVTVVQTKDRTYEELSVHVLLNLQQSIHMQTNLSVKQLADYFDEMDNQVKRRREKDFRNAVEAKARDTFSWAHGVLQIQVPRSLRIERSVNNASRIIR